MYGEANDKCLLYLFFLGNFLHWVLFNTFYHESFQKMQNKTLSEYIL